MTQRTAGIIVCFLAVASLVGLEAARHLHWRLHRDSGFVPSTQHWCMVVSVVGLILMVVGIILVATA